MATEGPKKYTARVVMPLVTIGMEGNLIKLANVENTGFIFHVKFSSAILPSSREFMP